MKKIRVAVNGYGTIGKHIVAAVLFRNDMDLTDVADVASERRIKNSIQTGHSIFASSNRALLDLRAAGVRGAGCPDDLPRQVDPVADATVSLAKTDHSHGLMKEFIGEIPNA
jgi:glyceraldehyde-3-phosphate dehydrogenase (NAD(P))